MRTRIVVVTAMVMMTCLAWPPPLQAQKKESAADMRAGMARVFVGWVDMPLDDWALLWYDTPEYWAASVARLNSMFHRLLQTKWLPKRTVVAAKHRTDTDAAGSDLQIRFSDVRVPAKRRTELYLAIHFIDVKSGVEIGSVPIRKYRFGTLGGFERHLEDALDQLSRKIFVELTEVPILRKR